MVNPAGAVSLGGGGRGVGVPNAPANTNRNLDLWWQIPAWRFYGAPAGTVSAGWRCNNGAIGEVRHVLGWIAQQIGRVGWHVYIDGEQLDDDEAATLMLQVSNPESTIIIATNLVVAGELNYCAFSEEELETNKNLPHFDTIIGPTLAGTEETRWYPVSVINNYRTELINSSALNLRAIWPHPAQPTVVDPPLRSVLDVLTEIEQLQDLAFSQNRSRIAQMGILTIANELNFSVEGGDDFGTRLEEIINAPIADPRLTSAAPIILRAPADLMGGADARRGFRGIEWTTANSPYDDRLDEKMRFLIQRLAWGFPVAPEILLGMTATNRAVAFQIEETTYRSHIEPIARLVGRIYAQALRLLMKDEQTRVDVLPDATELLARRHSVADAKDLYDRGLVRASWLRRVAGVDEEDAATDEDVERIQTLRKGAAPGPGREMDPSEVAGNEPVRASGDVQEPLREALSGAVQMARTAAVTKVGNVASTRMARKSVTPELDCSAIPKRQLPSFLGTDRLDQLGVSIRTAISPTSVDLADWWCGRLALEGRSITDDRVLESSQLLSDLFAQWVEATICAKASVPLPELLIEMVISSAFDETANVPAD